MRASEAGGGGERKSWVGRGGKHGRVLLDEIGYPLRRKLYARRVRVERSVVRRHRRALHLRARRSDPLQLQKGLHRLRHNRSANLRKTLADLRAADCQTHICGPAAPLEALPGGGARRLGGCWPKGHSVLSQLFD